MVKTIKPPVQTNEIFYGGTASLILSSTSSVVLFDIQQQKTLAELNSPPVKYVVWSSDGAQVALLSKHTITIANKNFGQHTLIHERVDIRCELDCAPLRLNSAVKVLEVTSAIVAPL